MSGFVGAPGGSTTEISPLARALSPTQQPSPLQKTSSWYDPQRPWNSITAELERATNRIPPGLSGIPGHVVGGMASGITGLLAQTENALAGRPVDPQATTAGMMNFAAPELMARPQAGVLASAGGGPIRAYHGSPHLFDRFDMSKIGTGEGAQAYGHGLYFAGNEGVAKGYRNKLSPVDTSGDLVIQRLEETLPPELFKKLNVLPAKQSIEDYVRYLQNIEKGRNPGNIPMSMTPEELAASNKRWDYINKLKELAPHLPETPLPSSGHMYEVNLNVEPGQLLDWDKPLGEQSSQIQQFARNADISQALGKTKGVLRAWREGRDVGVDALGSDLYRGMSGYGENPAPAAAALRDAGIPGIQYLDQGSRRAGDGTRNYVMFDDNLVDILRRYGVGGLAVTGGATAAGSDRSNP